MDKIIPISIVAVIIILGFITKSIDLNTTLKRIDFTNSYRNKFIDLVNGAMSQNTFNQQLYYELTTDVKAMQFELGSDGIIAYVADNLKGFSTQNYQLLVNFLPELRNVLSERDNYIMMNRYNQSAQNCDDMFIRHLGTLKQMEKAIRKNLFNPISCFSEGIKSIVSLPILIFHWLGFTSVETTYKIKRNWFVKLINMLITFVGFLSGLMSIIIGWSDFLKILCKMF